VRRLVGRQRVGNRGSAQEDGGTDPLIGFLMLDSSRAPALQEQPASGCPDHSGQSEDDGESEAVEQRFAIKATEKPEQSSGRPQARRVAADHAAHRYGHEPRITCFPVP